MKLDLEDKIVLVTGGSKGIGLACAKLFQAEGARVVVCSRSSSNLDAASAQLPGAKTIVADLTSEAQALKVIEEVERDVGPIDILVNCAGAAKRTPASELTPAHWRAAMDAKFFSYINVTDPVVKRMSDRRSGVIINVIGSGGKVASPTHLGGGAANAALMLATVGLANAYAGHGIRVIGINPGRTETDRVAEGMKAEAKLAGVSVDEALAAAVKSIPMGRMAKPEEISQVVVFMSSPSASYVTGVIVNMDGALTSMIV